MSLTKCSLSDRPMEGFGVYTARRRLALYFLLISLVCTAGTTGMEF